jgi:hypothetical protein
MVSRQTRACNLGQNLAHHTTQGFLSQDVVSDMVVGHEHFR